MGILRKLAELVVEFPEQSHPAAGEAAPNDDVLAAIERARKDVESSVEAVVSDLPLVPARTAGGQAAPSAGITVPAILSLEEIYARAHALSDDKSIGVDKVEAMLADPEMSDLAPEIRARLVRLALKNMGHELHEVILDAARRDKALDQYGEWLAAKVAECEQQVEAANAGLEREIQEFTAQRRGQIAANNQVARQLREEAESFARVKETEEDRLFRAVAPFVAAGENPVVIDRPVSAPGQPSSA